MGCLWSSSSSLPITKSSETEAPKQYSWDKRQKVDPKDFTIENLTGETAGRKAGSVNGQQFIIQNCQDANIYIFDHTATVSIDDCVNCKIFLGPVKTSVFVRDCKECKLMVACQQFRTRDCQKLDIFLSCVSQPIIEASTGMKFGCFQYHYPELEDQFNTSGLSIFNNNWSNIHDFTPVPGETNFSLLPEDVAVGVSIPVPTTEEFSGMQISTDLETSIVPRTLGMRRRLSDESCLVVFFCDGLLHTRAKSFMEEMKRNHAGCILVQSKEVTMQPGDAERVFATDSYASAVKQGSVVGFEYCGEAVCQACQETCVAVSQGSTGVVFVSASPAAAAQQIDQFYTHADMQMNA